MHGRDALWLCILLVTGCATSTAPRGHLQGAEASILRTHGGWVDLVERSSADPAPVVRGELIAVDADSLWILTPRSADFAGHAGIVVVVPWDRVAEGKVRGWDPESWVGIWASMGALSTISHGWILGLTLPVWTVSGIIAAVNRANDADIALAFDELAALRAWARFPQGMPEEVDRRHLHFATAGR